jgi:hypothetical protein
MTTETRDGVSLIEIVNLCESGDSLSLETIRSEVLENGFRPPVTGEAWQYLIRLLVAAPHAKVYREALFLAARGVLDGCDTALESAAYKLFIHKTQPALLKLSVNASRAEVYFDWLAGFFRHNPGSIQGDNAQINESIQCLNRGGLTYQDRSLNWRAVEIQSMETEN